MPSTPATDTVLQEELDRLIVDLGGTPREDESPVDTVRRLRKELSSARARNCLQELERLPEAEIDDARVQETPYRQIFETIDVGLCLIEVLFDATGKAIDYRFLEINPAFARHTGLANAEGRRMRDLAPDHDEHWFETYGRVALTGEATRFINHSAPLARWFDVYAFRVGRPEQHRVVILFSDITRQKRTQDALRDSKDALDNAHRELRDHTENLERVVAERTEKLSENVNDLELFSYSLIHDLRAPLRAMGGFSEILETDYGDRLDEEGRSYLRRIKTSACRLDQLIQDVLAYSRVLSEDVTLGPIDPARIVTTLIAENPALQPPRVEIELGAPLHPVRGHEAYLMQVLSNLVYNAVKFVTPGTKPIVRIWTERTDNEVRLFVRDNGIGFPPEARKRLFGMFQRFHRQAAYEGTGMGLAIVRKAIERMGGSIDLDSAPGEGSTFIVRLAAA